MQNIDLIHQLLQRLLKDKGAETRTPPFQCSTKTLSQTAPLNQVFIQKCFEEYYLARIWLWAIPVYHSVFSPDQILDLLHEFVALIAHGKQVLLIKQKEKLTFTVMFDLFVTWLDMNALEKQT